MDEIPATGTKLAAVNPTPKCIEPGYCFRVDRDGKYRESDITVEYRQAVCEAGIPADDIVFKIIPAVKIVSILHRGAYSALGNAYALVLN